MPYKIKESEIGLRVLVDNSEGHDDAVDIVAVHGLGAHPHYTWCQIRDEALDKTDPQNYVNWLMDAAMLPKVAPHARIMRYGYHSNWTGEDIINATPRNISQDFLPDLADHRKDHMRRPLIFIAHSFGGLVVLQTLLDARDSQLTRNGEGLIYDCTIGLVLFGTPLRGDDENAHRQLIDFAKLELSGQQISETALSSFKANDEQLLSLVKRFLRVTSVIRPYIACFYEKKPTNVLAVLKGKQDTSRLWVPEASATLDENAATESHGRACNHFELNKFLDPDHPEFRRLSEAITNIMAFGSELTEKREQVIIYQKQIVLAKESQPFQAVMSQLSPPDPHQNYQLALRQHTPDTGEWLLQSDEYRKWKYGLTQHLWLFGKAGCGKESMGNGMGIFYFSFSDKTKQSSNDLLRSLIAQLAWKAPELEALRSRFDTSTELVQQDLDQIFRATSKSYERLYLVLDGLDESPNDRGCRTQVLAQLTSLAKSSRTISIFATSRDDIDVRSTMAQFNAQMVPVEPSTVNSDIEKFVVSEMSQDSRLSELDEKVSVMIREGIMSKADGMFRWASCQLEELKLKLLSNNPKPKYVEAVLAALPKTLYETYEQMLMNIDPIYRWEALTLLRWVAYAERPLSLVELAEATTIDPHADVKIDLKNPGDPQSILRILAGFIVISNEEGDIAAGLPTSPRAPMHSYNNPFMNKAWSDYTKAQNPRDYTTTSTQRVLEHPENSPKPFLAHDSLNPFSLRIPKNDDGAASFYRNTSMSQAQHHPAKRYANVFHESDDDSRGSWRPPKKDQRRVHIQPPNGGVITPAADRGRIPTKLVFQTSEDVDFSVHSISDDGLLSPIPRNSNSVRPHVSSPHTERTRSNYSREVRNAFHISDHWRISLAHFSVKEYLESDHIREGSAKEFSLSSQRGHKIISQSCVAYIMHHNRFAEDSWDMATSASLPLMRYASLNWFHHTARHDDGDVEFELTFLESRSSRAYWLRAASQYQHNTSLLKVIRHYRPFTSPSVDNMQYFSTALPCAILLGLPNLVTALLARGWDANALVDPTGSALQLAAREGRLDIVHILLQQGADVNLDGSLDSLGNALHEAAKNGHQSTVKGLIGAGADVNAEANNGSTALCIASSRGFPRVVRRLLKAGADVNHTYVHPFRGTYTALAAASCNGHLAVVSMLLAAGAHRVSKHPSANTPVAEAACGGHVGVLKLLLTSGARVDEVAGSLHQTPLMLVIGAAVESYANAQMINAIRALLDASADVNYKTQDGITPLMVALGAEPRGRHSTHAPFARPYSFNHEILQLLLQAGAEVNLPNAREDNVLMTACRRGELTAVQALLRVGADVNLTTQQGHSALMVASMSYNDAIVRELLDAGAVPDATSKQGHTALVSASACGAERNVTLLLSAITKKANEEPRTIGKLLRRAFGVSRTPFGTAVETILWNAILADEARFGRHPTSWSSQPLGPSDLYGPYNAIDPGSYHEMGNTIYSGDPSMAGLPGFMPRTQYMPNMPAVYGMPGLMSGLDYPPSGYYTHVPAQVMPAPAPRPTSPPRPASPWSAPLPDKPTLIPGPQRSLPVPSTYYESSDDGILD